MAMRLCFLLFCLAGAASARAQDAAALVAYEAGDGSLKSVWLARIGVSPQARLLRGGLWRWSKAGWSEVRLPSWPGAKPGERDRLSWFDEEGLSLERVTGPEGRERVTDRRTFLNGQTADLRDASAVLRRLMERKLDRQPSQLSLEQWGWAWSQGGIQIHVLGDEPDQWLAANMASQEAQKAQERLWKSALSGDPESLAVASSTNQELAIVLGKSSASLRRMGRASLGAELARIRLDARRLVSVQWFSESVRTRTEEAFRLRPSGTEKPALGRS